MPHRIPVREGVIQGSAALQWFERYDIINFIALSRLCRMPAGRRFIRNDSGPPERKEADSMYRIAYKKDLNEQVTLMKIEAPLIAKKARPGQFIIFRIDEYGERVPILTPKPAQSPSSFRRWAFPPTCWAA